MQPNANVKVLRRNHRILVRCGEINKNNCTCQFWILWLRIAKIIVERPQDRIGERSIEGTGTELHLRPMTPDENKEEKPTETKRREDRRVPFNICV